ncbi:hypothetical protein Tco_1518497 [Tanacetum coccineum]
MQRSLCALHILDSQKESVFHTEDNYRLAGFDLLVEDIRIQYLVVLGMDNEGIAIQVQTGLVTAYILRGLYFGSSIFVLRVGRGDESLS